MNSTQTKAIVLSRTNFGEADRIVKVLTPDQGKLSLMARGARKIKSKLAGGIELFSISDISYLKGKGDIGTLISARMDKHYGSIVGDIDRLQLGYEIIKLLDRSSEDKTESEYFDLLAQAFEGLNDTGLSLDLIRTWFQCQLLKLSGHSPNLLTDTNGNRLLPEKSYNFDYDDMHFVPHAKGKYGAAHIKALRLFMSDQELSKLKNVNGVDHVIGALGPLVNTMLTSYIRI